MAATRTAALALALTVAPACRKGEELPRDLAGTLVFVSNREGRDAIYLRRLPDGADFLLAALDEPVGEPALSPDGRDVAFTMGGRIGLVSVETHRVRFLTLGVDWKDASPSWRPDGRALVVSSRRTDGVSADLHLLPLSVPEGGEARRPLTQTVYLDETVPVFSPDAAFVVFIRAGNVYRLEPGSGRIRRLTGGFRVMQSARFLSGGRLVCLWSQGKQFGIDLMDADGENRATLSQGTAFYRTLAPSPDGRYLAATLSFEADALKLRQEEHIRLLDVAQGGKPLGTLARSWRSATHSPHWGR